MQEVHKKREREREQDGGRETDGAFSDSGFCVSPNGICHEALREISAGVNMAVLTEAERK